MYNHYSRVKFKDKGNIYGKIEFLRKMLDIYLEKIGNDMSENERKAHV